MSNKEDKQYGLILPKKKLQLSAPKPTNVFGNDNSSGEEEGTDWVKRALKEEGEKHKVKKQTKLDMQKALKQDPTIYQYDEVYDVMEQTKVQTKPTNTEKKKPKYIINLLKAAERRKKEQEHRIERMVQKEREAEGEMYADKESFVTSAYRAKLEEFKKMEEEEAKMERIEAMTDVTKQEDMSSFYRHLYAQTVNKEQIESTAENPEPNKNTDEKELTKIGENSLSSPTENKNINDKILSIDNSNKTDELQISVKKPKKSKQYRQRIVESDESESDQEITKSEPGTIKETTVENKSPTYYKNDNSNETKEPEKKKQKLLDSEVHQENDEHKGNNSNNIQDKTEATLNVDDEQNKENEKSKDGKEKEKQGVKKDKSSIWQKRTVGPVFEAALQRYYARKAARMAAR